VIDQQEIVVKALARQVKGIPIFAGATILGDGRAALILDVLGVAERARIVSETRSSAPPMPAIAVKGPAEQDLQSMLLLKSADDGRMALPLDRVSRLEIIAESAVERIGDQKVLRYGEDIMPLVAVSEAIPERRSSPRNEESTREANTLNLVVVHGHGGAVGLIVEDILDVVTVAINSQKTGTRPGVHGCTVIQERVTELLDVDWILNLAAPYREPELAAS
jgi:two-component system chemotaxis sensor kinase CheA